MQRWNGSDEDRSNARWAKSVERTVAYSPKGAALAIGLVGALVAPSRIVGAVLVVAGVAYDTVATFADRRLKRRRRN